MEALLSALIFLLSGRIDHRSFPTQTGIPAGLRTVVNSAIDAGQTIEVKVEALTADSAPDPLFAGLVQVGLDQQSTPQIGCLLSGTQCAQTLSLAMESGKLKEALFLRTPLHELKPDTIIKPGDPVLSGQAIITAQSGATTAPAALVQVKSPLDLRIDRIEVQQGVRQNASDLWISEREMLVRIFVTANRDVFAQYKQIEGIRAKLTVRNRNGLEIPGSPFVVGKAGLNLQNIPTDDFVFDPIGAFQKDGADSLNFILPASSELQLGLAANLETTLSERDTSNNTAIYGPMFFGISRGLTIQFARLRLEGAPSSGAAGITTDFPSEEAVSREMEFVKQAFPVAAKYLRFLRLPDETRLDRPETFDPQSALTDFLFSSEKGVRLVYLVDDAYFPSIYAEAGVRGYTRDNLKFSVINPNDCRSTTNCGDVAHELGHVLGLGDTYTAKDRQGNELAEASNNNPRRDDAVAGGNVVEPGNFSWFKNSFTTTSPWSLDPMGNGYPVWTDAPTWSYLKAQLLFDPFGWFFSAARELDTTRLPDSTERVAHGLFVLVQGAVASSGSASFRNCYTQFLPDDGIPPTTGTHSIETLDANANVLETLNFTPSFRLAHTSLKLPESKFSYALPFTSETRRIRLRVGSTILATRTVSPNVPSARFLSELGSAPLSGNQQVSWTGSDADSDPLTYSLYYSPDGLARLPLTGEMTATTFNWNVDQYPSGPLPRLTLVATDGVNSTVVDSKAISVPNRPPRITILEPRAEQQFKVGENVTLAGSYFDPEEDLQLRPQIQWSSNIQGALGSGKAISSSVLSPGTHVITASGTDTPGAVGTASVTIVVRADDIAALAAGRSNLDFGEVAIGSAIDLPLFIRNFGNTAALLQSVTTNNARFRAIDVDGSSILPAGAEKKLQIRFVPNAPGEQTGSLTIEASNGQKVEVLLKGRSTGNAAGALASVSAADFVTRDHAPDSIAAAFGSDLASAIVAAATIPLPLELDGTSITVRDSAGNERSAPLLFISPNQINYVIPSSTTLGPATVIVRTSSGKFSLGETSITNVAPGLFTANSDGKGVPAGFALQIKPDNQQVTQPLFVRDEGLGRFVPLPLSFGGPNDRLILVLFGTGLRHRSSLETVSCSVGGALAVVEYAGEQGAFVGLDQLNIALPRSLIGAGEVDLHLSVEGKITTVRVAFASSATATVSEANRRPHS